MSNFRSTTKTDRTWSIFHHFASHCSQIGQWKSEYEHHYNIIKAQHDNSTVS